MTEIQKRCKARLRYLDTKVIKYLEQKELVGLGLLAQTDLTYSEYKEALIEKQKLREEFNAEQTLQAI